MNRVRIGWSGWPGSPGLTTYYVGSATVDMTPFVTFLNAIKAMVPPGINWVVPSFGDQINDTDGQIVGAWAGSGGGTVVTTGTAGAYSGATGFCIDWQSTSIIAGRRRQGRSYFVPGYSGLYQSDGSLDESKRTLIATAANALIAALAGELKVWSRPFPGKDATPTSPAKPPRVGAAVSVINAFVPDIAAVLRSRRT